MTTETIQPTRALHGTLRVPSDRSITVRAAILASVAEGVSYIREPLESDDTSAALSCMAALGARAAPLGSGCDSLGLRIPGLGLRGLRAPTQPLFCNSSGTTMRLLAGFLAGQSFDSVLDGSAQLRRRPMRRVTEPLRCMGARIEDTDGGAPLTLYAAGRPLRGLTYDMPIASAQVKSALLLAGLYADAPVTVREPAPTRDHTERMLRAAGVQLTIEAEGDARRITVYPPQAPLRALDMLTPGDFSSAAFFIVAAAITPGAYLRLVEVGLNPTRTGLLDALKAMGAMVTVTNLREEGGEPVGDLEVVGAELRSVEVGGALTPRMIDEFPIFAVAATQAQGVTLVRDAEELRVKESNRLEGFIGELRKLGARIEATADGFVVEGPTHLHGAVVDGLGDHRVAMALAIAGLRAEGATTILGAECVAKTYPAFFRDLSSLIADR
ncbi:MAG: 3-phosphoshikimate 1-carboxyvinyltransferase [Thermoflexales bacterium]|nr:3-phosphoshikimate 1-carboxyvinyltransferase [Thermoflexales bacterium]MDW8352336.1 3-phosphoshikimate 1-carboxyvinyltransferase [Anaerolineae bacterium]